MHVCKCSKNNYDNEEYYESKKKKKWEGTKFSDFPFSLDNLYKSLQNTTKLTGYIVSWWPWGGYQFLCILFCNTLQINQQYILTKKSEPIGIYWHLITYPFAGETSSYRNWPSPWGHSSSHEATTRWLYISLHTYQCYQLFFNFIFSLHCHRISFQ